MPPDHLCASTAADLVPRLRSRELSAKTLLVAHLERISSINDKVNALVTLDADAALQRAGELDEMAAGQQFAGRLHGLPVAIKDVFPTAKLRTTFGSKIFAGHLPETDAIHVSRLRAAGAIIIGKTNTAEFAYGAQTTNPLFGTTRNPFDLRKTVSGSSGGAASALAAGLAVLADGSDLGGSIRAPAGFAGVVGLRPTSRIVPLAGTSLPFDGLNVPGPMARSVADVRLMLQVMAGAHPADPLSQGIALNRAAPPLRDLKGLRLAWCMTPGGAPIDPQIETVLAPANKVLCSLGAQLDEAEPELKDMVAAQQVFRDWSARMQLLGDDDFDQDAVGAEIRRTLRRAKALTVCDLEMAERTRRRAWQQITTFWEQYDFCVWPTNCQLAYDAEADTADLDIDETPILVTPALGVPAISIPFGTTPDSIPVGLQLIGSRFSDCRLLDIAELLGENLPSDLPRFP